MSWKTTLYLKFFEMKLLNRLVKPFELIEDIKANQALMPLTRKYLPWTDSALRPAAVQMILNDIVVNNKQTIVELGGGISTIYICRLLTQLHGDSIKRKLYCIEHDEKWAQILNQILIDENISKELFEIIHCPLEAYSADNKNLWYGKNLALQGLSNIDLLLVDGPPAYRKEIEMAREPALPFFEKKLMDTASVYLDDINRSGERKIASKWHEQFNYALTYYRIKGGFALLKKSKQAYNI